MGVVSRAAVGIARIRSVCRSASLILTHILYHTRPQKSIDLAKLFLTDLDVQRLNCFVQKGRLLPPCLLVFFHNVSHIVETVSVVITEFVFEEFTTHITTICDFARLVVDNLY